MLVIQLNLFLAVFNLIPLPPLDGFNVLIGLVPRETASRLDGLRRFGPGLLIGLFLLIAIVPGAAGIISRPVLWPRGCSLGVRYRLRQALAFFDPRVPATARDEAMLGLNEMSGRCFGV